tara:strand:- start:613 stop:1173 length:561 start_codon:yes stop_codon:yes gene_type:complete
MVTVYITASVTTRNSDKELVAEYIRKTMSPTPVLVKYWGNGEIYNPEYIKNADVLVMMDEKNSWKHDVNNLPPGVKREFSYHIAGKKKVLTAYRTLTEGWKIYDSHYDFPSGVLNSVSGSKEDVKKCFKDLDLNRLPSNVPVTLSLTGSANLQSKNSYAKIALPREDDGPKCDVSNIKKYSLLLAC